MSRRDYRHRESKKPKKDAKKLSLTGILPKPVNVEEIKKVRKRVREEGEGAGK